MLKSLQQEAIDWQSRPAATLHFGAAHKSLVRIAKKTLYGPLETEKVGLRYSTEDTLRTLSAMLAVILISDL